MTITTKVFHNLQSGIKDVSDLRARVPINDALNWLGTGLVDELNAHFAAVSTSISAALATLLATANTWTAAQTTELTAAGTAHTLRSSDAGATDGPVSLLDRNSASPAASDIIGAVVFSGRDTAGNVANYARLRGIILDPSDASEDGAVAVVCLVAGVATNIATFGGGVQIGTPTGGNPGVGNLNVDGVIQKDGTQVVGARVTGYSDPFGAESRAAFSITTVTTTSLAQFVKAMYTDLKAHGLVGN
jgi:hypothetical protein